jgi:C1A family cysteine protease
VFGFTVYESFESPAVADTGMVPMPERGEQVVGGHCVIAYGFDNATRRIRCRNSWGQGWGVGGDFFLPYSYFDAGLCSDFWTLNRIGAR